MLHKQTFTDSWTSCFARIWTRPPRTGNTHRIVPSLALVPSSRLLRGRARGTEDWPVAGLTWHNGIVAVSRLKKKKTPPVFRKFPASETGTHKGRLWKKAEQRSEFILRFGDECKKNRKGRQHPGGAGGFWGGGSSSRRRETPSYFFSCRRRNWNGNGISCPGMGIIIYTIFTRRSLRLRFRISLLPGPSLPPGFSSFYWNVSSSGVFIAACRRFPDAFLTRSPKIIHFVKHTRLWAIYYIVEPAGISCLLFAYLLQYELQ